MLLEKIASGTEFRRRNFIPTAGSGIHGSHAELRLARLKNHEINSPCFFNYWAKCWEYFLYKLVLK